MRGGIIVRTDSGHLFTIAFGFDLHSIIAPVGGKSTKDSLDAPNLDANAIGEIDSLNEGYSKRSHFLPAIWGSIPKRVEGLKAAVERFGIRCRHLRSPCTEGKCPHMPKSVVLFEWPHEQKLDARIHVAKIQEDTVFVIHITISPVFELDSTPTLFELHSMIDSPARAGLLARLGQKSIKSQKELIVASIIPPLLHELSLVDIQAPLQIWMRLPTGLRLRTSDPESVRHLSHGVLFWSRQQSRGAIISVHLYSLATKALTIMFAVGGLEAIDGIEVFVGSHEDWTRFMASVQPRMLQTGDANRNQRQTELLAHAYLAGEDATVWAKLRKTSTRVGVAYVVDVHLEMYGHEEHDALRHHQFSPIESQNEHRDLPMVQSVSAAMSGVPHSSRDLAGAEEPDFYQ